jgi:hypothetical protein
MAYEDINRTAQFPNIDQMGEDSQNIYIREHDFRIRLGEMIAAVDTILSSANEGASTDISESIAQVQQKLNSLISEVDTVTGTIRSYEESITEQSISVEMAYERLHTIIDDFLQSSNINLENSTSLFNIYDSYKNILKLKIEELLGKKSKYDHAANDDKRVVWSPNTFIHLRDIDQGIHYKTVPFTLDPEIDPGTHVKICEFTPKLDAQNNPHFLAELIISGNLFLFKGYLTSSRMNKDDNKRIAGFDAEYAVNNDYHLLFKVLYDEQRHKVALAFIYDITSDNFVSLVDMSISINLLVGTDLVVEEKNTVLVNDLT